MTREELVQANSSVKFRNHDHSFEWPGKLRIYPFLHRIRKKKKGTVFQLI